MGSIVFMSTVERFVDQHKDTLLPHFQHLLGAEFTSMYDSDDNEHFYAGYFTLNNGETYPVHFAWVPEEGIDESEQEDYRQGILSLEGCVITSIDIDGWEMYEDIYLHLCVDGDADSSVCVPLGYDPMEGTYSSYVEEILG